MSDESSDLEGFYVIKAEKLLELTKQTESAYYIFADMLQEQVSSTGIHEWSNTSIINLMNHFLVLCDLRGLLVEIAAKPSREIIALAAKYKIKDILVSSVMITRLNSYLLTLENNEKILERENKVKIILN